MMKDRQRQWKGFFHMSSKINHYLLSILIIGLTVLLCIPFVNTHGYHVVSYILLFVVSLLATFMGIGPVFLASALSALVWNFFFIPPNFTFHIDKAEDILMFGMFFIIALLNGIFTVRVRKQKQLAKDREEQTNALFQITRDLSKASGIDEVLSVAFNEIKKHFAENFLFVLQDGNNMLYASGRLQKDKKLSLTEYRAAEMAFKEGIKTGANTETMPSVRYTFYPLPGSRINPGVLAIQFERMPNAEKQIFWDTFLTLVSNALEREFLDELAQKARFLDESDRLYKTLFNSISHELRIPVATIMGASDTLLNAPHSGNIQSALCTEIFTASMRLNRVIDNLLNMSRLESGMLAIRLDWYDINDLVNKVIDDLKNELKLFSLQIDIPENMPLVRIDFGLMEQVLYNLLFNATQHAPVASVIHLKMHHENDLFTIELSDKGPGFPPKSLQNVFEKFFRVDGSKSGGLGLGLSIVKGFVEAHKGSIRVENGSNCGALFTLTIPSEYPNIEKMPFENE